MLAEMAVLNEFTVGAATGLGHSLGSRLVGWVASWWSRWTRRGPQNKPPLLKKVQLKDLRGQLPAGMQLCRYRGDELMEAAADNVPERIGDDETLWLVPAGAVWLATELTSGGEIADAEVAVEFDPTGGLHHLLRQGEDIQQSLLGGLVAGGLLGILNSPGWGSWPQLLAGDEAQASRCLSLVNRGLQQRGLRCTGLRNIQSRTASVAPAEDDEARVPQTLVEDVRQVRTPQDWQALTRGLAQSGIPMDRQAEQELQAMQDEVLQRQLSPEQAAMRLSAWTAAAMERAGVDLPDLSRWQTTAARLAEPEAPAPAVTPAAAVATVKRPGTWWVWSRPEVDRRLLRFLQRVGQHCRAGLDQALLTVADLPSLRKLRDLHNQIALLDELLITMPAAEARTVGLRLDGQQVKEAVRSLESAVTEGEKLRTAIDTLLRMPTENPQWQPTWSACTQSTTLLVQHVRDRRAVR